MRTRILRPRVLFALAFASSLLPTLGAAAATLVVDVDGTYDVATENCTGSDPAHTTIVAAVTAAVDLDTILVCPGTYNESQILIAKALTVQSVAGAASTIIDGNGGGGLAQAGTVYITTGTGNVLFDGFTVRNAKSVGMSPTGTRFNIRVSSPNPVTITVSNNILIGTNTSNGGDFGLYAAGPTGNDNFIFQYNQLSGHGSNPILIERHLGPTDVSFNTFDRGTAAGTTSAYVNMSHSNTAITSLQKVTNNVIDLGNDPGPYTSANASTGIGFIGALIGTTLGTFNNIEISNNTIINLRAFRRGISFSNNANSLANQAIGLISNAVISCNSITGPAVPEAGSTGIRTVGLISNPTISGNEILADIGFRAQPATAGHVADTAVADTNSFTTGAFAADWQSPGALDLENNWWGSATGPTNAGNPLGTGGVVSATGPVDFVPWLGTGTDADVGPCFVPDALDACNGVPTCTAVGVCDAPDEPDGTTCDDGNACTTADQCTAGVCAGPGDTCGDGVIDGACGEVCDDGAGNGTNLCCSASCGVVDSDTDTVCDRDDPCTNGVPATKHKLIATKLLGPEADNKLTLSGSAVISLTPVLNPVANGVRVLITSTTGATILDTDIPDGAYDPLTRTGWRVNGAGTSWTYKGPGTTTGGIYRVVVKLAPKSVTGGIKFKVKGKNGSYPATGPDLPVLGTLVLDPPAAVTGQCVEARFLATSPARPSCALKGGGATLKCK